MIESGPATPAPSSRPNMAGPIKQAQPVQKNTTQPSLATKIFIILSSVIFIPYACLISLVALVLIYFEVSGTWYVDYILAAIGLIGINLFITAIRLLMQLKREDHLRQRLIAIAIILASLAIATGIQLFPYELLSYELMTSFYQLIFVPCLTGVGSLIWLMILLWKKDAIRRLSDGTLVTGTLGKPMQTKEELAAVKAKTKSMRLFAIALGGIASFSLFMWLSGVSIYMPVSGIPSDFLNIFAWLTIPSAVACIILLIRIRG